MTLRAYRWLLKLPCFRGRNRLVTLYRQVFFTPATAELWHGIRFEPDPIEWTQSDLLRDGVSEPLTAAAFAKLLRPGDTYVDIGAHVGFHTLLARFHVGSGGRVIALEPQPYNCSKLLANWRANGFTNLIVYVAAAGDLEGAVTLRAQRTTDTARLSLAAEGVSDGEQQFQVPIRRVESVLSEQRIDRVQLMKIDVEGFELAVVNGIGNALQKIDHLIIELLDAGSGASENTKRVVEIIRSAGFELRTVEMQPWDGRTPLPENNFLALRPPK